MGLHKESAVRVNLFLEHTNIFLFANNFWQVLAAF
jgi:hypothetical protein